MKRAALWFVACALLSAIGCSDDASREPSSDGLGHVDADGVKSAANGADGVKANGSGASAASGVPRHLVVIVVEALRADHVGAYGYDQPTTPHLDALSRRGLRFDRAYAGSSSWGQSASALWTGRLPSSGGATGLREATPHGDLPNLVTLSRRAGRHTVIASNQTDLWERAFTAGCDELQIDSTPGRWNAEHVTDRALDLTDSAGDVPLTLIVDFADATEPHLPAAEVRARFEAPVPDAEAILTLDWLREHAGALPPGLRGTPGFADLVTRYDAEVAQVDAALGRLVAGLESRGVLDDALLVVTSLHGVEWLEHGYVGSGWSLHEEVLRVPLVMVAPNRLTAGAVAAPVSLVDLLPTMVSLFDWEVPGSGLPEGRGPFDGEPLLAGRGATLTPATSRGRVIAELVIPETTIQRAAIHGNEKLIQQLLAVPVESRHALTEAYAARVAALLDGTVERPDPWGAPSSRTLFDLTSDPRERVDLAVDRAARVEALTRTLDAFGRHCREHAPAAREAARRLDLPELNAEDLAALEQLGYL